MPIISRPPIMHNNNRSNHTALLNRQLYSYKETDTHVNITFLCTGSTVAVKNEDRRPWMHRTIGGHRSEDDNGRLYKQETLDAQNYSWSQI